MLYKIFHNSRHPLDSELPELFQPARITRFPLRANSLAFTVGRHGTEQYKRCFIPATTELWNMLPSCRPIVESKELQKFKVVVNNFFKRWIDIESM